MMVTLVANGFVHDLIEVISQHLLGGTERNTKDLRIASVLA
jgi:hypothetical protein